MGKGGKGLEVAGTVVVAVGVLIIAAGKVVDMIVGQPSPTSPGGGTATGTGAQGQSTGTTDSKK